jgi:hypothetical protein
MSTPVRRASPDVALVDLLDRVLGAGVVVTGDITLSIAGVDLVYLSLHALLASVRPDGPNPPKAFSEFEDEP